MNATTKTIIDRLPDKLVLIPGDIALAFGMMSSNPILDAIKCGRIAASSVGGKFFFSRDEAARYIESTAYKPQEGTIRK